MGVESSTGVPSQDSVAVRGLERIVGAVVGRLGAKQFSKARVKKKQEVTLVSGKA